MKQIFLLILFINTSIAAQNSEFIKGVDVSFIPQIEDSGGEYYLNGIETDPLEIFKQNEINYIRLRLWHTPENGYCGLKSTLEMASRIKEDSLKFLLDIHYSDTWADPSNQYKPAAWNGIEFSNLKDSVYTYTSNVISAFINQNTPPDIVQIGNEIIGGILWPDGKLYDLPNPDEQLRKFAELIKEGLRGVYDASDSVDIKTIIHIPILNGNINDVTYFYNRLNTQNVDFDIIGLSYYPWWHGNLNQLKNTLDIVSNNYEKDIIIVETAYPWTLSWNDNTHNIIGTTSQLHTGYPATAQGQYNFLKDLIKIVKDVPDGRGAGVFYWAPEYISVPQLGSSWENLALFDFNNETLWSISAFHDTSTSVFVNDKDITVSDFALHQNYPNPFNPVTSIKYELSHQSNAKLIIYNSLGEEINILVDEVKNAGRYFVEWNGRDSNNNIISSGVYLIMLITDKSITTIKSVLLK
jgi:arabinogalactan endo-1,4-beta-galactosidase